MKIYYFLVMNMYCKKLKFLGVRKLDCIYYNEKTSIEKIREIERRLVKFCRPEVYEKFVVGNDIFNTDVETKFRIRFKLKLVEWDRSATSCRLIAVHIIQQQVAAGTAL